MEKRSTLTYVVADESRLILNVWHIKDLKPNHKNLSLNTTSREQTFSKTIDFEFLDRESWCVNLF